MQMKTDLINRREAKARRGNKLFSALLRLSGENELRNWLPDMDLNHDKQIQSLLCYRYTIGQAGALGSVNLSTRESSC